MADKTELRAVPVNVSPELAGFLNELRAITMRNAKKLNVIDEVQQTLDDLLKGAAPSPTPGRGFRLPPVIGYKINKLPNSIEFVLTPMKIPRAFPPITDVDISLPNKRTQLWRAFANENALNAEFVKETDTLGLADHPPPGVEYRYWLRYVTDIESQAGPFSPVEGIEFTADEVANPEAQFDPTSGGIFLETFEDSNLDHWTETQVGDTPTITFPAQGVVGGIVAQFAGDQAWRVHDDLIPYDPSTLYRFRIGVRYTAAPTDLSRMKFYAGVVGVAADGVTLINSAGANTVSSQHYVAASGADLILGGINNWQTFIGYFSGLGTPALPSSAINAPSPLYPGTKYFKPVFVGNYPDGDGTFQVDYVRIESLDPLDIALTGTCTPDSIVVRANSLKIVLSYANASGTFEVRYGSIVLNGASGVTFSILSNPQSLFASINSAGAFSITGGFDLAEDTASITFRATFNGVNVDRTVQLTKALEGGMGWTPIIDIDSGSGTIVLEGATLTKVGGGLAWDSSVYSLEAYTQGAVASCRPGQTNSYVMFGLNSDPSTDAIYTSLDYAWYFHPSGAYIYESGVNNGGPFAYSTTDVFMVTYDGETVRYWQNSTLVRSVLDPNKALSFDSSFYEPGVKLLDVNFNSQGPIATSNRFATTGQVRYVGSTIEKVGGSAAYDSSAYSIDGYAACFLSFTPQVGEFCIGLNTDPQADSNYTSIDFSWIAFASGTQCWIYESGNPITDTGAWSSSTTLSITYDGQYVRYLKDNVVIREVLLPKRVLYFDSAFAFAGAKATNVQFGASGVVGNGGSAFIGRGNCAVINDTIEKIGGANAWDSDVYSREGYTEGAFVSFRASQTNKYFMVGLNSDPTTDSSYASLDYAWYARGDGACQVYESGTGVGDFGTYTISTVFAVRHVGSMVQYIKDGVVVRSVTRVAKTPLFFDSSFADPGGRCEDVHFGPAGKGAEADPSAVYLETFEDPWQTSFRDFANSSSLISSYPNSGQFGGKVLSAQNQLYIISNENIPFDENALYRISTRMRRTVAGSAGSQYVYCGLWGYAADGVTLINNQWNCANSFDMGAIGIGIWQDFVGYVKGHGTTTGVAANVDSPTNMDAGICFVRPSIVMNYGSGTGTTECDFIKLERLVNPDDADNTLKKRICPDEEFDRSTGGEYWYKSLQGTCTAVISPTGGAIGGKVTLTGDGNPAHNAAIYSRRRPGIQTLVRKIYTISVRWRRTATVDTNSFLIFQVQRTDYNPNSDTLSISNVDSASGHILLGGTDVNARTVNVWQEDASICFFPDATPSTAVAAYVQAVISYGSDTAGDAIEVDFVSVVEGATVQPMNIIYTTSNSLGELEMFKNVRYNSGSAGTFTLPTADPMFIGAKIYFEQIGTGALTIAPNGTDTLESPPNTTGNRTLSGRYARAFAECVSSTSWRITGQLA